MKSDNLIELAVAFYKDKVQEELLEKFRDESRLLLQADAEARRTMVRANVKAMAQLKITLEKFKFTYKNISKNYGKVIAIDEYIKKIETEIKKISYRKNNMRYP